MASLEEGGYAKIKTARSDDRNGQAHIARYGGQGVDATTALLGVEFGEASGPAAAAPASSLMKV
jgi:hypothetical protein